MASAATMFFLRHLLSSRREESAIISRALESAVAKVFGPALVSRFCILPFPFVIT